MCNLTPVAGRDWVYQILKIEYLLSGVKRVAGIHTRVAENLLQHKVPGVSRAHLQDIISLRRNEDAFGEWRRSFGEVLDRVHKESPFDESQFAVELREAAQAILKPRIDALEAKLKGSPVLTKILTPATLAVGGGLITYQLTGAPDFAAIVAAGLTPLSWVVDKIHKRFSKAGRNASLLREFYGNLIDSSK